MAEGQLVEVLSDLTLKERTNILILGETGVGKSTWINAFANYLSFEKMEDAAKSSELVKLIPTQFIFTDENNQSKIIKIGSEDENEVTNVGQSATQYPKAYRFILPNGQEVCLIDTPGIGDVRGIDQDKKNFENILSHLSHYEEIHAVCVLLKPNNSRLTVAFRFCVKELLIHLHKSAAENIIFCFTNARNTFYRPGDTLPVLEEMLKGIDPPIEITSKNQFCFDNESFRFLALLRNEIKFSAEDSSVYCVSWDRSVKESCRLFQQISRLEPHKIKQTLSLNEARRVIVVMSKPLAKITWTIESNIRAATEKKTEIQTSKKSVEELLKSLYFDGISMKMEPLGYPRTVCTDANCISHVQVDDELRVGRKKVITVYNTECHKHCYLDGIPAEIIGDPKVQRCKAIDSSNNCNKCGHSYLLHQHMTYELKTVKTRIVDGTTRSRIKQKENQEQEVKRFVKDLENTIVQLQNEEEQITNIYAQFGVYLKENALTPFNDALTAHLDMMIKEEEQKPIRDLDIINRLYDLKKEYEKEKEIIMKAMSTPTPVNVIIDPSMIPQRLQTLFELPINGNDLKDIYKSLESERENTAHHFQTSFTPPPQKKKSVYTVS